ncbi:MAG: GAF domain-containing protein [Leptolyngbyaceae cyanobacterium SM1_4_3]|nr:GAF domain-containing protein [Leptolyngbyaceae cyanobacterium SM1_4_3]
MCKQIKSKEAFQEIPIIFMSFLSDTLDKVRGFEVGAVDYVTKPLDFEEVLARVNTHITIHQQRIRICQLLEEKARSELTERRHRLMIQAVLDTVVAMNSTLDLPCVLREILASVGQVVEHDSALVILFAKGEFDTITQSNHNAETLQVHRFFAIEPALIQKIQAIQAPYVIADTNQYAWYGNDFTSDYHSFLAIPILSENELLGILSVLKREPHYYKPEMVDWLQIFAVHASLAIQNAHLYKEAQELAVMKDRQRLARELHDSVSQTLYAVNSIAEALPHVMIKKPHKIADYLSDLSLLARNATAEMRSLLIELRADTIIDTPIAILVRNLGDSFTARSGIPVTYHMEENISLSPSAKIVFYRVTQESLSNIYKHAHARHIAIHLRPLGNQVELQIQDDGQGFDISAIPVSHFGLKIMRERVNEIGGMIQIESKPHQGTKYYIESRVKS